MTEYEREKTVQEKEMKLLKHQLEQLCVEYKNYVSRILCHLRVSDV